MPEVILELVAIQVDRDDCIAVITLNRPSAKNALNKSLTLKLAALLGDVRERKRVRAVILMGAGGSFCAGVDLRDPLFADPSLMNVTSFNGPENSLWQLRQFEIPVIAAVAGPCITGGMELALNCDIIIAAKTAFFQDTHSRYGIVPGGGMTSILPKSIGLHAAKWMSLTGARLPAQRAYELGLVGMVVDSDSDASLKDAALAIAQKVCGNDAKVTREIKRLIHSGLGLDVVGALEHEAGVAIAAYQEMAHNAGSTRTELASKFSSRSKL